MTTICRTRLGSQFALQEEIEQTKQMIVSLEEDMESHDDVARTITALPLKLNHRIMIPLGKHAMVPGTIKRSNEILCSLGDNQHFTWRSAHDAAEMIERRKKNISAHLVKQEHRLNELNGKKMDLEQLLLSKQVDFMYEAENIREIHETEQESEQIDTSDLHEEDYCEYFEIENEEKRREESQNWNWDELMKRMEELEAFEAASTSQSTPGDKKQDYTTVCASLKKQGNRAFASSNYDKAIDFYTQAISLETNSHILYCNRSAANARSGRFENALDDAENAIKISPTWVKGHYRKAMALASLEKYNQAATAFDEAFALCPSDAKLKCQADLMREKAAAESSTKSVLHASTSLPMTKDIKNAATVSLEKVTDGSNELQPVFSAPSTTTAFKGSIVEREHVQLLKVAATEVSRVDQRLSGLRPAPSRFHGNNAAGNTITFEPVGEAQVVQRVSRFKAARSARKEVQ